MHHALVESGDALRLTERGREVLEPSVTADAPALRAALEPVVHGLPSGHPPGTWRAGATPPLTLPHHPVVTHRGGYPDGS